MIKTYTTLTKPGIILGNLITAAGGFALASKGNIDFKLLFATLLGLGFIIASACVFNNYTDRTTDQKMNRTQNRPLAKGTVSNTHALIFGTLLGLIGATLLFLYTHTLILALTGFFVYVVLYGISKYKTTHGTIIGSVAGGIPILVGYCAVTHHFDLAATLLFSLMVLWQMPHFYAIVLYQQADYVAAGIPTLPIIKGPTITKIHMVFYISLFILTAPFLTLLGYTGKTYLITTTLLGCLWLFLCIKGFKIQNEKLWARQMFLFSLAVILIQSILISIDFTY